MRRVSAALLWLGLAGLVACSSSDDAANESKSTPQAQGGECGSILDACHFKDVGEPGIASDCHDLSHTFDDNQCVVRVKECVSACEALPCPAGVDCSIAYDGGMGGAGHDAGTDGHAGSAGGGGHDAGPDGHAGSAGDAGHMDDGSATDAGAACADYCGCLSAACGTTAGYPYGSEGDCLKACAGFSPQEMTCFSKWCTTATATPNSHNCQHAWGQLNLSEC